MPSKIWRKKGVFWIDFNFLLLNSKTHFFRSGVHPFLSVVVLLKFSNGFVGEFLTVSFLPPSGHPGDGTRVSSSPSLPKAPCRTRGDGTVAPLYHRALLHSRLYFRQLSGLAADMIVGVGNVLFF